MDSCGVTSWLRCFSGQAGIKAFTAAEAAAAIDTGCGGTENLDPGRGAAGVTLTAGQHLDVEWLITIGAGHSLTAPGVSISLADTGAGESFDDFVLADGVPAGPPSVLKVGPTDPHVKVQHSITLPADKTCSACTLRWLWYSPDSNGVYITCADVKIVPPGTVAEQQLKASPAPGSGPSGPVYAVAACAFALLVVALLSVVAVRARPSLL